MLLTPKKSIVGSLTLGVCLSLTGISSAQAAPHAPTSPALSATSISAPSATSISAPNEALSKSDIALFNRIASIDVEHASDADLSFLGFTADRDRSGKILDYRMDAETRAQMNREQVANGTAIPAFSAWNWLKCGTQLAAFIVGDAIPVGKAGAVALRAIGIIKRRGVSQTISILKRFRSLKGAEAKDAASLIAAIVGLDFLAPCKAALGI